MMTKVTFRYLRWSEQGNVNESAEFLAPGDEQKPFYKDGGVKRSGAAGRAGIRSSFVHAEKP